MTSRGEKMSVRRRVHCMYEQGFRAEDVETWLNTLPGDLIAVYWSGAAGTVAVTEEFTDA